MAQLIITIADANVPLIAAHVATYNAEHGTALTAPQWARRILAQEVLRRDIEDATTNTRLQKEAEARAAVDIQITDLLGSL